MKAFIRAAAALCLIAVVAPSALCGPINPPGMVASGTYTVTGTFDFTNAANTYAGDGSALSGVSASASLAVATGSSSGFTGTVSSPTAVINFDTDLFSGSKPAGTTAYLTLNPSTITMLGPSIDLSGAEVTGSLPAASIAAGSLGASVIASSVAANAILAAQMGDSDHGDISWTSNVATVDNVAAANVAAGSLGASVLVSSVAKQAVYSSALASTDSPNDNEVPTYDAATDKVTWVAQGAGGVGAASDTEVLWDNSGSVDGMDGVTWNDTTKVLSVSTLNLTGAGITGIDSFTNTGSTFAFTLAGATTTIRNDGLTVTEATMNLGNATSATAAQITATNLVVFGATVPAVGNTVYDYIYLFRPDFVQGTTVTVNTSSTTASYGNAVFSDSVSTSTNWVGYNIVVPMDNDSTVAWYASSYSFILGGADTAAHRYQISYTTVAPSANLPAGPDSSFNPINMDFAGDGSGASGDLETISGTALTGWSGFTQGRRMVIWVARDGDDGTNDASTVDSTSGPLVIRYGKVIAIP